MSQPTQVLEFGLGGESYCLDIAYIDEIVDAGELTMIPNSPPHVEGVMDLRGRTTSIIDPKTVFGIEGDGARNRIVVFDPETTGDQGAIGWVVDEVYQVVTVTEEDVDETTLADEESIRGIVKRDDGFVVWVEPEIDRERAEPEAAA
ncbi:purine-binding chemotaxis protein CheW [Halogranum gelatinilyticum]|uniref:Purine-binding chemotaxis protein CheW n=1 Tax=Halogranum gelatinilyticum TaxID=660521 RepID=A0A1G9R2H4_9EURY|nr:chemotaxis protein CheW [Halogranum gelatinilyticum]SDM17444.1 purine-binding chemotaxis protein CheW [Halogranum gelatinilyticum]